jgi:hypothetical protein
VVSLNVPLSTNVTGKPHSASSTYWKSSTTMISDVGAVASAGVANPSATASSAEGDTVRSSRRVMRASFAVRGRRTARHRRCYAAGGMFWLMWNRVVRVRLALDLDEPVVAARGSRLGSP